MRYQTDEAILVKSSLPATDYRSGFDVLYPLAPMGIFQVRHRANRTDRPLLLSFKGSCKGKPRAKYAAWHNAKDIVVLCTDMDGKREASRFNYHELQVHAWVHGAAISPLLPRTLPSAPALHLHPAHHAPCTPLCSCARASRSRPPATACTRRA